MNYLKHYTELIRKAKLKDYKNIYTEKHHIIPKCVGGKNTRDNIVRLSAKEHYIAHLLLVKIYSQNPSLIRAVHMMMISKHKDVTIKNSKTFGWLREKFIKNLQYTQTGIKNTQYGTIWITNGIQNKKIKSTDIIPSTWYRGMINFNKGRPLRSVDPTEYKMLVLQDLGMHGIHGKRKILLQCPFCKNTIILCAFSQATKSKECCADCKKHRR